MNKEKIFLYPLYQKLGIKSSKVKEKASEFLYTLDYKSPGGIGPVNLINSYQYFYDLS